MPFEVLYFPLKSADIIQGARIFRCEVKICLLGMQLILGIVFI